MLKVTNIAPLKEIGKSTHMTLKLMAGLELVKEHLREELKVVNYATLDVVNEGSGEMYTSLILITESGEMYSTSSPSLIKDIEEIFEELNEVDAEWCLIKVVERQSKNNQGTFFKAVVLEIG